MPKYIARAKTWLSHENRAVNEGEEFDTVFPEGMRLSSNIELVGGNRRPARSSKPKDEPTTSSTDATADGSDDFTDDPAGDSGE